MYSLPTLSSLCPKKRKMEKSSTNFSRLLGHLGRRSQKQKLQEERPEKGIHLQRLAQDAVIILQVHTSTGATSLLPSIYNMEVVEVPVDRSSAEIQAWPNLNAWWPCTTTSKEVETNFQQEGPSLWISRDLMLKKTLSFQPDSRGKWMPNYEGPCAITPVITNVDKPSCRCSQEILCQKK